MNRLILEGYRIGSLTPVLEKKRKRNLKDAFNLTGIGLERVSLRHNTNIRRNEYSVKGHDLTEGRNDLNLIRGQANFFMGFSQCCRSQRQIAYVALSAWISNLTTMGAQICRAQRKYHLGIAGI